LISHLGTGTSLLLFSYTSVTLLAMQHLNCVTVGSHRVVWVAPSIDCSSEEYARLRLYIYCMIVFPVLGFPALLTVGLLRSWRRRKFSGVREPRFVLRWGVLFESYSRPR
jgi:hypothetical protein